MQANHSYDGKPYSLEQTLFRSVSYWATRLVKGSVPNAFYPNIVDLIQIAQQKLTAARAKIEEIWNGVDGFRSVSRYVSRVVTNALIDEKRRRETQKRKPGISAASLDEPVSVTDEGTDKTSLGDTISGEVEIDLPFAFYELRGEMTDEEYRVLESAIKTGATISELAEQRGESKSTTGRIAKSAKKKSRKWIKGLRRGPHQRIKARFLCTLGWGSSLRPDHISKEVLETWETAIPTVPFHDPASEWRPPTITKQSHVRAKRECWNAACQNGLAIGVDNLVLPTARQHEAIRFLPAYTGTDNRLCEGCKKAAKPDPKMFSDRTTWTASQIGHAEPNVEAIPVRDDLVADAEQYQEQHNFFVGNETKRNFLYNKIQQDAAIHVIKSHEIPKQQLADIANVPAARLSDYLRNRPVSQEQADRITGAVINILLVWETFAPIKIALDDPQAFAKAVELARQVHAKLAKEQADTVLELPLRMKPLEGTAAAN